MVNGVRMNVRACVRACVQLSTLSPSCFYMKPHSGSETVPVSISNVWLPLQLNYTCKQCCDRLGIHSALTVWTWYHYVNMLNVSFSIQPEALSHRLPCLPAGGRRCPRAGRGRAACERLSGVRLATMWLLLRPSWSKPRSWSWTGCCSVWTGCGGSAPSSTCESAPTSRRSTALLTS